MPPGNSNSGHKEQQATYSEVTMDDSRSSCSICFLSYDYDERKPLVLPCSHSFCEQCLLQMNSCGDRLCPNCRKSWRSVNISSLVTCYQLIQEPRNSDDCMHHRGVRASFWCSSCNGPFCKKCLIDSHKTCHWVLIEDKLSVLKNKYPEMVKKIQEIKLTPEFSSPKYSNLGKELRKLEQDFAKYDRDVSLWQREVKNQLAPLDNSNVNSHNENSASKLQQKIDALQRQPQRPNYLLFNIIGAYLATQDESADSFILNFVDYQRPLNPIVAHSANEEDDDDEEEEEGGAGSRILDTLSLEEGKVWRLRNSQDTRAAMTALTSTSVRPSEVLVHRTKWKVTEAKELMEVLSLVKCDLKIRLYNCFWKISDKSTFKTWMMINPLFKDNHRCTLVEVFGHLDWDCLNKLHKTLKRVGLTLSSAADMDAVNDLSKVAFYDVDGYKLWPGLTEIDLSILQTFRPHNWNLTWEWRYKGGVLWRSGMPYLQKLGITMSLHFPNIKATDIDWMVAIMSNITNKFEFASVIQKLYLPRTSLPADALLGVLRDCCLRCVVHLPFTHTTEEEEKKTVEKTFYQYKFTVVWDLE